MLTYGIPPEFRGGVNMKPPYAIGSVPSLSGHAVAYRWRSLPRVRRHRASKPQGSSERVLPWQITMDQLIFASLSHTHYRYEVGMLKVPALCTVKSEHKKVYGSLYCLRLYTFDIKERSLYLYRIRWISPRHFTVDLKPLFLFGSMALI